MRDETEESVAYPFLAGGGEMGARMRAHTWEATALGAPAGWPQSLRSMVSACLQSPMASAILWGPELLILYNDAYIPLLAGHHPDALARPAADAWGVAGQALVERFRRAGTTGAGFAEKRVEVTMVRQGAPAATVWDFAATPIRGEGGDVAGFLNQGVEITERVTADRAARESDERLQQALSAGDGIGTWQWDVVSDRVRADGPFARLYGVPVAIARRGAPIADFFRQIHKDDFPRVQAAVAEALRTGEVFSEEYRLVSDADDVRWVIARGRCEMAADGTPLRFPGISFDITGRKRAEARQAALLELSDRLHDLVDPTEIALVASEVLGHTFEVSRVGYGIVDTLAETITVERDWNAPGIKTIAGVLNFRAYGSYIDDLKRGETVAIADVAQDARTRDTAAQLEAISARAFVNMPLIEQGRFVALFYVNHRAPRSWRPDDLLLMREIAERVRGATERARTEQALRISEQDLRLALAAGQFGTWKLDLATGALNSSPICRMAYGRRPDDEIGYAELRDSVHPDDRARRQSVHDNSIASGSDYDIEYRILTPQGETRWVAVRGQVSSTEDGRPRAMTGVTTDITERKRLEERLQELNVDLERRVEKRTEELLKAQEALRQSQKMEVVGQLTGGIAHDFNNLLQGITGSLQIATRRIAQGRTDDLERFMAGAVTSANRAAALTHRLLAFSRRQPLDPRPVQINGLIASLEDLLRRTIGEAIDLEIVGAGGLWTTLCDPNQLESSLLNLVINARDAMPDGGRLTVETGNAHLDNVYAAHQQNLRPGQYVCIAVTDTGTGMSEATIAKAFEPFFTTKGIGQGTGLGLSMVYGFAGQSEGHVKIYSEVGRGTTVRLYLPRYRGDGDAHPAAPEPAPIQHADAGETVLVVEDEPIVRALIVEVLLELGYNPLEAADGPEGVAVLQSHQHIDLLVTDIGLPGLNGRQVAEVARRERPGIKILFMTGYAENAALASGFLEQGMTMVTKPFAIDDLATRIRELIEDK